MSNDISINFNDRNIQVDYVVNITDHKDGEFSGFIPGFNLAFSATSRELTCEKAEKMIHYFFDFWIENQGWKSFVIEIHKLGFRSPLHDFQLQNLLKKRPTKAKFRPELKIEGLNLQKQTTRLVA